MNPQTEKTGRKFNTRAFVTLMIAFAGVGLPISGFANHIYGFSPLTIARHAWMAAHNAMGILFAVFATWHIVLNRHMLWSHIRSTAAWAPTVSREATLAGAITMLILGVAVGHAVVTGE